MKDITVLDVLELPIMSNAKLKAGHGGLKNTIQYVNILDNRYDDTDTSAHLPKYGENFYITSMYYGQEDPAYAVNVIKHFIEVKAAAVCIIDEYISDLPEAAYALANSCDLPVIFIDRETPYPIIISSVMELKLSYQKAGWSEDLLITLTGSDCTDQRTREILEQINPGFASNLIAFYCVRPVSSEPNVTSVANEVKLLSKINQSSLSFASEYRDGLLIVHSFKNSSLNATDDIAKAMVHTIRQLLKDAVIGISHVHPLMEIGKAISQARTAANSGSCDQSGVIRFQDLGAMRLIMELSGKPALDKYYHEILNPLEKYDNKYNSHLLDTVTAYIENNMDYVRTSKAIFVHENTVRYRLGKVKSLVPYGTSDMDFEQTLYLFYKITKLKESR